MLAAEHLDDANTLEPGRFPVLVLPYGPAYPAAAEKTIRGYLSRGGAFLSTGGYVFDRPLVASADGMSITGLSSHGLTAGQLDKADASGSFNTRFGTPGDTMMTRPDEIGAFDPAFELDRVARLVSADDQFIAPPISPGRCPLAAMPRVR